MPNYKKVLSNLVTSSAISTDPTAALTIEANGVGQLQITFGTSVPPSLQQYAISSNTVIIPVHGSLKLSGLNGVINVTPVNVTVNATQQLTGIINTVPVISPKKVKHASATVSNGTITSLIQDGNKVTPPTQLIYYTGFGAVQLSGYGVSLTISDYDPIAGVPTGEQIPVTLVGSTSQYTEAFTTIHRSATGYIIIQNITGTGQFDIFIED
jgi:hypothetical protein